MASDLREIEWSGTPGDPFYLRFSRKPIAKTEEHVNGEVNVDLDRDGHVVGVEMLSGDPLEWEVLGKIGKERNLRFDLLLAAGRPPQP